MLCRARNSYARSSLCISGYRKYVSTTFPMTANPIPAAFLRGGTSKGVFINAAHLPADKYLWKPIFLGLMGSPDPIHGRQLNGMGGGVSSLSKICVVGFPSAKTMAKAREDRLQGRSTKAEVVDVEYTFVQVGIKDDSIDLSGNCGNLSAMVGIFALDEGIIKVPRVSKEKTGSMLHGNIRTATVRSFNTNTEKFISTSFPVATPSYANPGSSDRVVTPVLDLPQTSGAGVPGKASQIILQFHAPAGARTGKLLPTGQPKTSLEIDLPSTTQKPNPRKVNVTTSLVDATNPTVLVSYDELATILDLPIDEFISGQQPGAEYVSLVLENIRQEGAKAMGLDPSAKAQPKIAILSNPTELVPSLKSMKLEDGFQGTDIAVHALSMGVLHKAVPMTIGLCIGVAARTEGTIPHDIVQLSRQSRKDSGDLIRILHPGGLVDVGADVDQDGNVKSAQVVRTGRRLMTGKVFW